jgi:hypothetical protein
LLGRAGIEVVLALMMADRIGDDGVCEDPAEAIRRAPVTCWAVATTSEMAWWVEKASTALAAGDARG